jgi:hypothetical protein
MFDLEDFNNEYLEEDLRDYFILNPDVLKAGVNRKKKL